MRTKRLYEEHKAHGGRVKAARHGHVGSLCTVTWHLGTLIERCARF